MTAVLIHATGVIQPQGRRNWQHTIERPVDFRTGRVASSLSGAELAELLAVHPDGTAPFWGTHRYYTKVMAQVSPGDVVFFTGKGHVLAVARLGVLLDNPGTADALWTPHPKHGSYRHVYSLAPLRFTEMPYPEFRARGGFGVADDFRGLRLIADARVDRLLSEFAPEIPPPSVSSSTDDDDYDAVDEAVAIDLRWRHELDIEVHATATAHVPPRGASEMRRGESALVQDYVRSLAGEARVCRYATAVGVTDVDVHLGDRHELIEAKSSAARPHLRQALAQLLDYAPALGEPRPDTLSVLVPRRPDDSGIALLHGYGVDCVHRRPDGTYARLAAPPGKVQGLRDLWQRSPQV